MLEVADMEMLRGLLVTVAYWENLANGDPTNRFSWSALPLMWLTKQCWWPNPKYLNVLPEKSKLCFFPFRKSKTQDGVQGAISSVTKILILLGLTNRKVPVENARTYFGFEMNVERYMIKAAIENIKSEEADTSEKGMENLQVRKEKVEKESQRSPNSMKKVKNSLLN